MIKLSVMYPREAGSRFDLDYYLTSHMALVGQHLGPHMADAYAVKGLAGAGAGTEPPYEVMAHLSFSDAAALDRAMAAAGPVLADIPNFTNVTPVMQVSEVLG